jgi:sugar transferase (PEP-CTERM/EpsH1 system associated)
MHNERALGGGGQSAGPSASDPAPMSPLHICHIVLSLEPGGLENGVVNVVNGLDPVEFRSSVCCLQRAGEFAGRLRSDVAVASMGLRPGNDPWMPLRVARLLRRWDVDIVHTRNAEPFFYGFLAGRLAGVPAVVHSEHGRVFPEKRGRAWAQRLLLRHVDAAFSVSEQLRSDLVRELHVPADRFEVLHNGVDVARFGRGRVRAPPLDASSGLLIGSVGRLAAVKNYALLLQAMARLPLTPSCRLVLIGDGPERAALSRLAGQLGLETRVEFRGHRDDVPQLLQALDLFVLPSLSEGMSNTVLEAMAVGLPILASDVGGNRELIEPGRSGMLFPPGDVAALAEQLVLLLGSPELRAKLGAAAARRARTEFSIEAMLGRYASLYRRVGARTTDPRERASA